MTKSAIFEVDGTLVDSVDLHASAWQEALAGATQRFTDSVGDALENATQPTGHGHYWVVMTRAARVTP